MEIKLPEAGERREGTAAYHSPLTTSPYVALRAFRRVGCASKFGGLRTLAVLVAPRAFKGVRGTRSSVAYAHRQRSAALRAEAKQPEQARGLRREARGNSQTAGKLWCDHQQVSNDRDACSSTRKISVLAQQVTEVLRLQPRLQCKLPKSCGRAQEQVIHRIPARKGAECELGVACSLRAEDWISM